MIALLPVAMAETLTIELVEADVHQALLLIAEVGDVNVVIPDTVQGKVTVVLRDVTWETAFQAVLAMEGLAAVPVGDAFWVAPAQPR